MSRIRKDIPDWYDIRDYDGAIDLDAWGWLRELMRRRYGRPDRLGMPFTRAVTPRVSRFLSAQRGMMQPP